MGWAYVVKRVLGWWCERLGDRVVWKLLCASVLPYIYIYKAIDKAYAQFIWILVKCPIILSEQERMAGLWGTWPFLTYLFIFPGGYHETFLIAFQVLVTYKGFCLKIPHFPLLQGTDVCYHTPKCRVWNWLLRNRAPHCPCCSVTWPLLFWCWGGGARDIGSWRLCWP